MDEKCCSLKQQSLLAVVVSGHLGLGTVGASDELSDKIRQELFINKFLSHFWGEKLVCSWPSKLQQVMGQFLPPFIFVMKSRVVLCHLIHQISITHLWHVIQNAGWFDHRPLPWLLPPLCCWWVDGCQHPHIPLVVPPDRKDRPSSFPHTLIFPQLSFFLHTFPL